MASILRQIVAGPRAPHPEANLDLCYVTDNIIATSGPGATYPQVAYRNPLKDLVKFLDAKHGDQWAIWEFRAEGTGYPDAEVYHRVRHYPWPDHHPPPFALIPLIMGSMRNWLKEKDAPATRVVVVHCKAGKGRSGTIACSYLISEEGWTPEDAMQRFTERRMRPGFGVGISIPSQQRWISYVDRWTKGGKLYIERPVEIVEVHVWGLRAGVKIAVEGYVEEGKMIKKFHTFHSHEKDVVRAATRPPTGFVDVAFEVLGRKKTFNSTKSDTTTSPTSPTAPGERENSDQNTPDSLDSDVIFRPSSRLVLPSSDVNIDFERRSKTKYGGFTMVTSVAHVWFNTFFEGRGPENDGVPDDSGVFEIQWEAMDGIKGSSRKGTVAADKVAVVWKAVEISRKPSIAIHEPAEGETVHDTEAADWRGKESAAALVERKLGMREKETDSANISQASSVVSQQIGTGEEDGNESADEMAGVKSDVTGNGNESPTRPNEPTNTHLTASAPERTATHLRPTDAVPKIKQDGMPGLINSTGHVSISDLPGDTKESDLQDDKDRPVGSITRLKDADTVS